MSTFAQLVEEKRGMKSYDFERTPEGHLAVHGTHSCGRRFENIAYILEPESANPVIHLPRPLGFNAVREIMQHHESTKNKGALN